MTNTRKISTRLLRKGALIKETYAICRLWDRQCDDKSNWERLRTENLIGANNLAWLREVVQTVSNRFHSFTDLQPLIVLAQNGVELASWRSCYLWHIGQHDALYYAFAQNWLYPAFIEGRSHIRIDDILPFVINEMEGQVATGKLSAYGRLRAGRDLLKMASDFGLLTKGATRNFCPYHLTDEVLLYVLHGLADQEHNALRILEAPEWRLFLMSQADVEQAILRLHQFRHLYYQAAGTIIELKLPYNSLLAYAESFVHG